VDWRKFVEELPAGLAILDENFNLVMVNKRISEKTGLSTSDIGNPLDTVHPEDIKIVVDSFEKIARGE